LVDSAGDQLQREKQDINTQITRESYRGCTLLQLLSLSVVVLRVTPRRCTATAETKPVLVITYHQ